MAIRAFAVTVAARIGKMESELLHELKLVVKKHLPYTSIAFQVRAREILSRQ